MKDLEKLLLLPMEKISKKVRDLADLKNNVKALVKTSDKICRKECEFNSLNNCVLFQKLLQITEDDFNKRNDECVKQFGG